MKPIGADDMTILPLDPSAARSPNLLHAGIVRGWMLFPDDQDRRDKYISTYKVLHFRERILAGAVLPADALVGLIDTALKAPAPEDLAKLAGKAAEHGIQAGLVFHNSLHRTLRGQTGALSAQKKLIAEAFMIDRSINEIWKRYRPVSAFWCALLDLGHETFEFETSELPRLLCMTNELRLLAERTIPARRAEPLIPPGEHLRLPEETVAALPPMTVQIS
ncbi:hypothetical protein M2192_002024 [Bradyrhizobium elkanii USDA 61]|nr:hypothetical protein [Bradyrhizobium elkanii]MCS3577772.1 hypothetical protein [Bradyrhizobium elkanii]MCS4005064.1 hypothetical protein [Bradyrhizobium elkanii USDA 61]MCW2130310.1 hypothetical protein [Bradyrhizobium elkanii]